jgi:cell division protein FtsB
LRAYWLVPAIVACGLVSTVVDRESGLSVWYTLRSDLDASRQRITSLVNETETLRAEIRALESDPFALESAIREDLELARPGETVVRFGRPGSLGRP